jgi:predicted kinase
VRLLLVTGLPGSGKSTLARLLAQRYGVVLLSKDLIKEPLLDALGSGDLTHSRLLSDASFAVLFAVARAIVAVNLDVILEGNFRPGEHEKALAAIPALRFVQVLCRIDEATRLGRLAHRARHEARHVGHRDADSAVSAQRSADAFLELPGERLALDGSKAAELETIDRIWMSA